MPKRSAVDRFMEKVDTAGPVVKAHLGQCWQWNGTVRGTYGIYWLLGRYEGAHRASHIMFIGPIPAGLVVDHLCGNRLCVNPAHLEAVSQRINLLRANTFQARNAAKTHCDSGHPFSAENTRIDPRDGSRICRTCRRESSYRQYLKRRAAVA